MSKTHFKIILLTVFMASSCLLCLTKLNAQTTYPFNKNITLRKTLAFPELALGRASGVWGYSAAGREYAIIGLYNAVAVVDVTNPDSAKVLAKISGVSSGWREIRTWGSYAYVTNETDSGIMVINLSTLPNNTNQTLPHTNFLDSTYYKSHALHIDENGFMYIYGRNGNAQGAKIYDLKLNPTNLVAVGTFDTQGYIHDGQVRNNRLYGCHIYGGFFSVVDVSNKANPIVLATQSTAFAFPHNSWVNDDATVLFVTDEKKNAYLAAYDISDLSNIRLLDTTRAFSTLQRTIPHNVYYKNGYLITSYYKDGIVIHDATRPHNLVQVGAFDNSPNNTGLGEFENVWGVYPYFQSGNLIASDMVQGLLVYTPTYQRACFLEGMARDIQTNQPLSGVKVTLINGNAQNISRTNGSYALGTADSGLYQARFEKASYQTLTINGIRLLNGLVNTQNVLLTPAVGIDEVENPFQDFLIYPNPAKDKIDLRFSSSTHQRLNIELLDLEGKIIYTYPQTYGIASGYNSLSLVLPLEVPVGIYFMKLNSEKANFMVKFSKL